MQKEILKLIGKNVETLYLTPMNPGERHSTINSGQRRQISKPRYETCITTGTTTNPLTFPTVVRLKEG